MVVVAVGSKLFYFATVNNTEHKTTIKFTNL